MNEFQIQRERDKLRNLHYWLTFSGMGGILICSVIFFPIGIVLPSLFLIAIGFSVYIIRSLNELEKKGWIVTYVIMIGIPSLLAAMSDGSGIMASAVWIIPLFIFYLYNWVLRYSITEWLSDLGDEEAFELGQIHEKKVMDVLGRFR
jgi:hypothetical protein